MAQLPGGTVTFLLTDVEGSTALWEAAPEAMRTALARHDVLFEAAVVEHGGVHIRPRGEGDSRFAVFRSAPDAVAAAVSIQRAFASEPWLTPRPIKVRIGLHTGEAELRDGDYYGSVVNRSARIRNVGHGGQVLLSESTMMLARDDVPDGVMLIGLGEHRLKDLARPERLFQLLASLDPRWHNLPVQPTALLGREQHVAEVRSLLRGVSRLVTLTGPGGTGKTRLGLQVAAELVDTFEHGAFFVPLASIGDPTLVPSTIAQTLGVPDAGGRPPLDVLTAFLRDRQILLLLDNFEQILPAATDLADLLATCPSITLLVTSRAPLQFGGEHEFPVPPLSVPDATASATAGDLTRYPAIALFAERAAAIRPGFTLTDANAAAVAQICARLDGLPLAIELAAARIRLLPPEAMLRRLGSSLDLLTGGRRDLPARQQTLRSAIAWSYNLLGEAEQRLFRRLSVFVGGFTLEAAQAVAGDANEAALATPLDVLDGVESLVNNSLVRSADAVEGEPRFTMLVTIREYGLEQLGTSGEASNIRERHLRWCVSLAEQGSTGGWEGTPRWAAWCARCEADHDNIRAAFRWNEQSLSDPELGFRMAGALMVFWSPGGHQREARATLARLLARQSPRTAARALALESDGYTALRQNDLEVAATSLAESLAISRELDDRPRLVQTLRYLSLVQSHERDYSRAKALLDESLSIALEIGDGRGIAMGRRYLADLAQDREAYAEAAEAYEQSLILARQRDDVHEVAYALRGLGNVARSRGEYDRARQLLRESVGVFASLRDRRCTPICLEGLACMMVGPGWAERATRLLGAAQAFQQTTGAPAPPSEIADYQRTEADAPGPSRGGAVRGDLGSRRRDVAGRGGRLRPDRRRGGDVNGRGHRCCTASAGPGGPRERRATLAARTRGRHADRQRTQQQPDRRAAGAERADCRAPHRERLQPPRHQRTGRAGDRHGLRAAARDSRDGLTHRAHAPTANPHPLPHTRKGVSTHGEPPDRQYRGQCLAIRRTAASGNQGCARRGPEPSFLRGGTMRSNRTRSHHLLGAVAAGIIAMTAIGWGAGGTTALAQAGSVFQGTLLEPNQKTAEVSTDELRQILKDGSATVFDARPPMEYATSHIPGALNVAPKAGVPMSVYVSDAAEVDRLVPDRAAPIVLYCNGPFCGKSKRLGEELLDAGYTNVRRYQLGAPTWRALVGVMQIEMDGVRYVRDGDRTAVFVDARSHEEYQAGSLPGARNIPAAEVVAAKDDGRLPVEDHNTRIVVFGLDTEQARATTAEIAKNAFHNVSFFAGTLDDLVAGLGEDAVVAAR